MTLAEIAQNIGIKEKHVALLLQTFKDECEGMMTGLKQAISDKNMTDIASYAHAIKGSAGNLRFSELSQLAKSVENAAKGADSGFAYEETLQSMEDLFIEIKKINS